MTWLFSHDQQQMHEKTSIDVDTSATLGLNINKEKHKLLKGWFTAFFLCMIVYMGCNVTCICGFYFLKSLIFHKFYLYCT